jgi:hypothetical protein
MVAFEISVNGEPLEPMECEDLGSLMAVINWYRGRDYVGDIYDSVHLVRSGVRIGRDTPFWPIVDLNIGDEITIRIVERPAPELPQSQIPFSN